jgi:hypothetical protein
MYRHPLPPPLTKCKLFSCALLHFALVYEVMLCLQTTFITRPALGSFPPMDIGERLKNTLLSVSKCVCVWL